MAPLQEGATPRSCTHAQGTRTIGGRVLWECKYMWTAHAEDQNWSPGPLAHGLLVERVRLGARVSTRHPLPACTEQGRWGGDLLDRISGPWAR